ncbi:MAG: AAA family ATPase [Campylobacterota bacterium]|nr:AAA family ATPase [Campylobacterota bacterium]
MIYWLVRANWGGDDRTDFFIDGNYWENGYSDGKYKEIVNRVKIGDTLLLADGSYVRYFAICTSNKKDGKSIYIDKWKTFKEALFFPAKGSYIRTIVQIKNQDFLKVVSNKIDIEEIKKNFYLSSLAVYDFMSLENGRINFSDGINLFIGENGSGKSQILKLLYSIIEANNEIVLEDEESEYEKRRIIAKNLTDIFNTQQLGNLVNKDKRESKVTIDLNAYKLSFKFKTGSKKEVEKHLEEFKQEFISKKSIFIPAKEVLSFFKGFRIVYEKKYLSFDKTYYNLCKALEEPLSKTNKLPKIIDMLESILDGKIEIIDGNFYLIAGDRKYEITLIAEGLRKIGMLSYLLSNEALDHQSILFWDEPEANMHPKLIDDIVSFLVLLANRGMQIFISTHSPYVIESFNNHLKKSKIKSLHTDDSEIAEIEALDPKNKITAYLLEDNKVINILDKEYGLLDDKLLQNFNDINRLYDKMRDIEWDNQ